MPDIQEAFMRYAEVLLAKTPYPRFATHDDELIFGIQEYAARHKIPKERFEFQMLYGIRQETMEELSQNGYNTRIYVPYGDRKSTRLNSSHVAISYAVFCLKK